MTVKSFFQKTFILLFISALLSALPLTFSSLFLLSWISFVPLFYVIIKASGDKLRYAFGRGFLFGFLYHACIYYWFIWFYPLDYVNLTNSASIAVVALAWFGISIVHGVLWCIPFVCCHFARKVSSNKMLLSLVSVVGIIAAQKITAIGELSFPWARISLGQYKATALIQTASIWGAEGVDILILLINALITVALLSKAKKRIVAFTVAAVLFCSNLCFGIVRINTATIGQDLKIMTVQASVTQDEKWDSKGDKICLEVYSSLTKDNFTDDVDLILWPESAVPKIYKNASALKDYKKLSKELDTPILAGIILKTAAGNTNNAVLVTSEGAQEIYNKRQMVPFGEYMPYKAFLSKVFPMLTKLNIIEDDYIGGNSAKIMSVNYGQLGNIICFESIYPQLTRQSTLDGAQLMIELTNDSWLKDSPAMYQHLAHGVFRSVENGRYLVRSANSGISAVIDNHGNIKSVLNINETGAITDTVQYIDKQTIYTKTGNILFPICCASVLIWLATLIVKKIKTVNK